jgi:hypothetical protein
MPWKVEKRNGRWVVVRSDTGKIQGKPKQNTKAAAERYKRALYAHADD